MATSEVQEELMQFLIRFCFSNTDLWQSFRGPDGIQLLVVFPSLSSEQQEHVVALLLIFPIEVADSKQVIAQAGGMFSPCPAAGKWILEIKRGCYSFARKFMCSK